MSAVRTDRLVPVALLASRLRWEESAILSAMDRLAVPTVVVDSRLMWTMLDGPAPAYRLALDREIARTRALYGALALQSRGIRVVNTAQAIEVCSDKWRTAVALRGAGLPTPRAVLALTPDAARLAATEFGYPVVVKPLGGSWGRRVAMLRDPEALDAVLDYCSALPHPRDRLVHLEEPIDKPGRDLRVVVVGGRALGATYRVAEGWRTNVRLGATSYRCDLTADIAGLAEAAAAATGAEIAGVDLVEGRAGELYVIEVNAGVEFRGFASAVGSTESTVDGVADAIAHHVAALTRLDEPTAMAVSGGGVR